MLMPRGKRPSEVAQEFVDAGYLEISAEDHPDPFGLVLDDGEVAVLQLIAKGEGAAYPQSFALGRCDLVPDTLGGNLPLEWAKDRSTFRVSRPMDVVVLNCWVAETKKTSWASNSSTSFAKSLGNRTLDPVSGSCQKPAKNPATECEQVDENALKMLHLFATTKTRRIRRVNRTL
jgi:hypothetical protein